MDYLTHGQVVRKPTWMHSRITCGTLRVTKLLSITSSYQRMQKAIVFSSTIRQLMEVVRHLYWIRDLPLASRLLCLAASMSYILHFRIRLCILSFEVQMMHRHSPPEISTHKCKIDSTPQCWHSAWIILSFLLSWTRCESLDKSWGFVGYQILIGYVSPQTCTALPSRKWNFDTAGPQRWKENLIMPSRLQRMNGRQQRCRSIRRH